MSETKVSVPVSDELRKITLSLRDIENKKRAHYEAAAAVVAGLEGYINDTVLDEDTVESMKQMQAVLPMARLCKAAALQEYDCAAQSCAFAEREEILEEDRLRRAGLEARLERAEREAGSRYKAPIAKVVSFLEELSQLHQEVYAFNSYLGPDEEPLIGFGLRGFRHQPALATAMELLRLAALVDAAKAAAKKRGIAPPGGARRHRQGRGKRGG